MPAIVREVQDADLDAEILHTMYDKVTRSSGLGSHGYRLEVVEYECPACHYDRMIRQYKVNPEDSDRVTYYCNKPSCPHHVEGAFGYARGRRASKPVIPLNEPGTWSDA